VVGLLCPLMCGSRGGGQTGRKEVHNRRPFMNHGDCGSCLIYTVVFYWCFVHVCSTSRLLNLLPRVLPPPCPPSVCTLSVAAVVTTVRKVAASAVRHPCTRAPLALAGRCHGRCHGWRGRRCRHITTASTTYRCAVAATAPCMAAVVTTVRVVPTVWVRASRSAAAWARAERCSLPTLPTNGCCCSTCSTSCVRVAAAGSVLASSGRGKETARRRSCSLRSAC
jgi:hypothetical protein